MTDYVKAVVTTLVPLATFAANIPVIFVTFRSRLFDNDTVAKLIASLAVSDIVNGVIATCCAGLAWSLQPGQQGPTWLLRLINSGMYTFGVCSIWHLAAVSVVKCGIIVRPLTHFTIFTDRVLRAIICTIWTFGIAIGGASNVGVSKTYFSSITLLAYVTRSNTVSGVSMAVVNFIAPTLVIMTAYVKVFLVVRRQVRSMSTAVLHPFGSKMIFGSSVRSAKNLFVMCVAYWLTFLPVTISALVRAAGSRFSDAVQFSMSWIYVSSSAVNGFLYIALHSSVRRELRRYLPCRRGFSVAPASTQTADNGDRQRHRGFINTGIAEHGLLQAPVSVTKPSYQRVTQQLPTAVL